MKKIVVTIITILLVAIVAIVCVNIFGNNEQNNVTNETSNQNNSLSEEIINNETEQTSLNNAETQEQTNQNSNILVAVFSRAGENYNVGTVSKGNTMLLAEYIRDKLNADLFSIEPVNAYPSDYDECTNLALTEKSNNARPEIKDIINNFDNYDTIFIGYPIWYGDVPMIINTFLESYNFNGKNIYLFNTHEGSGNAGTWNSIKTKLNSANVSTNGLAMRGNQARESSAQGEVQSWLSNLGF